MRSIGTFGDLLIAGREDGAIDFINIPIDPALTGIAITRQFMVLEAGGTLAVSPGIEAHIR